MHFAYAIAASISFAVGGLFMKYSDGLTRARPTAAVFLLFVVGAALQALAMKRAGMGVVYIFVLGLEALVALMLSIFILGESATMSKIIAVVLIVSGIALLQRA